jgi:uncharacterized protein (TIGR01777 family)
VKIAVTGSSGFVGQTLLPHLHSKGHTTIQLVRRTPSNDCERRWDPAGGQLDPTVINDCDVIVHLAGAGIADGRWSTKRKRIIRDSRVDSTALLARTAAELGKPPRLIVTSGVNYYGSCGDAELTETDPLGTGFLAEVCRDWEGAAEPARQAGLSVAHFRLGIVIGRSGGPLAKMLLPFKLGLGGRLSHGRQYMSWVSVHDAVAAIAFLCERPEITGPVNLTAPNPVTNAEFTRALASALRRPAICPAPAFILRLVLGRELADELLLSSMHVLPKRLENAGFTFTHPTLGGCLEAELGD